MIDARVCAVVEREGAGWWGVGIRLLGVVQAVGDSVWSSRERTVLEMNGCVVFKMTFEAIVGDGQGECLEGREEGHWLTPGKDRHLGARSWRSQRMGRGPGRLHAIGKQVRGRGLKQQRQGGQQCHMLLGSERGVG